MKKLVFALALCAALVSAVFAQTGVTFFPGPGSPATSGASYTGPGDASIGITFTAYYGLRAFSAATRGNKLVNVCDITGGTVNGTCVDLVSSASTGQIVSQSGIGTNSVTCPGTNCGIKIYYDLTGGNQCTSASCDVTQATATSMDKLGTGCAGQSTVTYCATSQGGKYATTNNFNFTAAQIFMSGAMSVTDNGNQQTVISNNGATFGIFFWRNAGAHEAGVTANGQSTIVWSAAYTNGYHTLAGFANGTTSSYNVLDSTVVTGTSLAVNTQNTFIDVHGDGFNDNLASGGIFLEAGLGITSTSSTNAQSLSTNIHTFWGF